MPTMRNAAGSARPTGTHRIILASALRRETHSITRQKRAGKTLRKMSCYDEAAATGRHRQIDIAGDLLDE